MKPQTPRDIAHQKLEELRIAGFSDTELLENILGNQLSGSVALEVMTSISDEYIELYFDDDGYDDGDIIDLDESLTHPA
jgi:hypothetical protein